MQKCLYHASKLQGLSYISPRVSTHQKKWVYATEDPVMTSVFLGTKGGDLTCQVGRDKKSGLPYICERFEDAFEERYAENTGSIYTVLADCFAAGKTSWKEEWISSNEVRVVEEKTVENVKGFLQALAAEGKLLIKKYPHRIDSIPEDKSDLIKKCIEWVAYKPIVLERVKLYHPDIFERVASGNE